MPAKSRAKRKRRRSRSGGEPKGAASAAPPRQAPKQKPLKRSERNPKPRQAPAPQRARETGVWGFLASRSKLGERPKAPWHPVPLTELATMAGVAALIAGLVAGPSNGAAAIAAGAILLVLSTGELCAREHFSGYKSHVTLLAVLVVVAIHAFIYFVITRSWRGTASIGVDVAIFVGLSLLLYQAHRRARAVRPGVR
jgi:hypothetical protein